ncbi:tetratricopeptide repeat protein [Mycetocola zhujimingii]|uniref:Tetratricopeptide repeat protein n=1 Tax=Mycetocola zhujimingii TaxID=2079792 RepID=A0A2U1TEM1_9MICO|nr:tetratricopeptide repeat protein [Mycetocola zhujimingii]PWC07223.1 hypothetical protein DF223_06190 [Mycetocola zhujimingii]
MPERPDASVPASRNPHLYFGGAPNLRESSAPDARPAHTSHAGDRKTLDDAARLWSVGKRRDALALLKAAVRANPDDLPLRLALAELYREMNSPDQAGRWGIVIEGWTTPVERDRLARMLAPVGIPRDDLVEFLALTGPVESYPDLEEVVDGPLAAHVAQRKAAAATDESPWGERLFTLAVICWITTVVGGVLAVMAVFIVAFFDLADARTAARIGGGCFLAAAAVSSWVSAGVCAVENRWLGAGVLTIVGMIAATLAVVTFTTT